MWKSDKLQMKIEANGKETRANTQTHKSLKPISTLIFVHNKWAKNEFQEWIGWATKIQGKFAVQILTLIPNKWSNEWREKSKGDQRKRKKVIDNIDKFFTQFAIGSVSDRFFERSIQPLPIESYRAFFLSALPWNMYIDLCVKCYLVGILLLLFLL